MGFVSSRLANGTAIRKPDLAHKKLAPLTLLDSYSIERLPDIAHRNQRGVRESGLAVCEWKRDGAIKQFGVNYRGSEIVLDERNTLPGAMPDAYGSGNGILRAGDRVTSAPVQCAVDARAQESFDVLSCRRHSILEDDSEVARRSVDAIRSLSEGFSEVLVVAASVKVQHGDKLTVLEDFSGLARFIYQG